MAQITEKVDVCVIGAGHAGCEAALACARMGLETVIFTVSIESIALMPCNPNIGGSSKGHLVRELDALGGEMGKNIDHTFIQSKMLNASKGPAAVSYTHLDVYKRQQIHDNLTRLNEFGVPFFGSNIFRTNAEVFRNDFYNQFRCDFLWFVRIYNVF